MNGTRDRATGRYVRTINHWSLDNFDDGFVSNRGRFIVYFSEHPRAFKNGKILRSIVAYEAYTGDKVEQGYTVHHKNKNTLDDSKENLEKLTKIVHDRLHADEKKRQGVTRICIICGKVFIVPTHRLNEPRHKGLYCSHLCLAKRGKSAKGVGDKISASLKRAYAEGRR